MTITETNQNHREARGVMQPKSIEEAIEALPYLDGERVLSDERMMQSPDLAWHVRNYPDEWERSASWCCYIWRGSNDGR